MPYKSEKQRRLMHAKHPAIAARWDAEYGGKIKKSFVPSKHVGTAVGILDGSGGFVSASKLGAKGLREAGEGGNRYASGYRSRTREGLKLKAQMGENAREFRALKNSFGTPAVHRGQPYVETSHSIGGGHAGVHNQGGKRAKNTIYVDQRLKKTPKAMDATVAHERVHANTKRSSWRSLQVSTDPVKSAREEARADMMSGQHYRARKQGLGNGVRNSYIDRARAEPDSVFGREYRGVQDKIHAARKSKVNKSVWGVVHKLDQADVHIVTTMTGPKKARLRKIKKKTTEI